VGGNGLIFRVSDIPNLSDLVNLVKTGNGETVAIRSVRHRYGGVGRRGVMKGVSDEMICANCGHEADGHDLNIEICGKVCAEGWGLDCDCKEFIVPKCGRCGHGKDAHGEVEGRCLTLDCDCNEKAYVAAGTGGN
jgi:hypothetical protein